MDVIKQAVADVVVGLILPFVQVATNGGNRLFWVYLVAATVIAVLVYRRAAPGVVPAHRPGFLAFLFPKHIWRHPSARTDLGIVLIASVVMSLLFWPLLPGVGEVSDWLTAALGGTVGTGGSPPPAWVIAAFTLALLVADDFAKFFAHYLMHKVPALWELHKVHHSAEVLTPLTAYRFHPLELVLTALIVVTCVGSVNALFVLAWGGGITHVTLFGANIGLVVFNLLGGTLRHSHIWFSFGPRLERWFISPAQHQIHHSCAPRHIDRNMGYHLAIWDRIAGTLYVPDGHERFPLGIGEETRAYRGVAANLLRPLVGMVRVLWPTRGERRRPTPS